MACFLIQLCAAALVFVSLASGRVVDRTVGSKYTPTIDELLLRADPRENDIFYEYRPDISRKRVSRPVVLREQPPSTNPIFHLLESLAKPKYVDASEFRSSLPPSVDINRQLTLMSASKSFMPPSKVLIEEQEPVEFTDYHFLPNPSPLFRDDFSSDDIEYYQENPNNSGIKILSKSDFDEALAVGPVYSTSVSVSSSVSYSKNDTESNDASTTPETVQQETSSPTDTPITSESHTLSSTSSTTYVPTVSSTDNSQDDMSSSTDNSQVSSPTSPRTAKLLRYDTEADYPEYSALSPLAHILGGFRGELGAFGGDHGTNGFVRGFRPFGF